VVLSPAAFRFSSRVKAAEAMGKAVKLQRWILLRLVSDSMPRTARCAVEANPLRANLVDAA
jgi:hypothetical protein